jgi:hypothetical protein
MLPDHERWYFWHCPAGQRAAGLVSVCVECDPLYWNERPGGLMVVINRECTHSTQLKKWRRRLFREATKQKREREREEYVKRVQKEREFAERTKPGPTPRTNPGKRSRWHKKKQSDTGKTYKR